MQSITKRLLSVVLSIALVISFCPSVSYADTEQSDNQTQVIQSTDSDSGTSGSESATDQGDTNNVSGDSSNLETEVPSGSDNAVQSSNETSVTNVADTSAFDFIYVDSKTIVVGETQNIVIGFKDPSLADGATLYYQKGDDDQSLLSVKPSKTADGAALFEIPFTTGDQLGEYTLEKVITAAAVSGESAKEIFINQDVEYGYSFAVVEKISEDDDMTVYALDGNDQLSGDESVEEAINQTEQVTPEENGSIVPFSARSTTSSDLVVALDAGHGGSDPGAENRKAGLVEKNLTLKIANYCRDALNTYSGVKVVMTRDHDEYVGLSERVQRAIDAGANLFVSFHINATAGATGFEVWVQNNSSWRYELHEESSELGTKILEKLEKLGLKNRGNKESDSRNGTKYSDGSPADYLTVLYESRKNNIPAVLIEHGFIDGSSADQALLSSEASLKQMGTADAEAIAEYYGLSNGIPDAFDSSASYQKTLDDGEYVINTSLSVDKVLDIPSASMNSGLKIQLYTSNGSNAQKFLITRDSSKGYYTIKNANSQLVLGLEKNSDGTYKKNVVQQTPDSGNNSQKWIIEENSDGTYSIKNAINPDYAMDVAEASTDNGTSIQMYQSNGSNAQKYNFLTQPNVSGTKTIDDGLYEITNANSGKVLDIASASKSSGANCQQYTSNGTAAQKFTVKYDGDGFYTIVNLNSGKALEVAGTAPVRSVNVQQGDLASTDAQKWAISDNGDGTYKLISKATGLVLDVASASKANGANVDAYSDNGTAAQQFTFKSAKGEKVVAEGDYAITSKLGTNKVLDVTSASKDNGAKIQIYKANGTAAQSFHFSYDDETGFYTITNNNSGKVLDLPSASTSNGTKIQQYSSNNTLAQRWVITKSNDGTYQISSALNTTKCIDIPSANTANGTKVQLYTANGTDAQKFTLNKLEAPNVSGTKTIDDGLYEISNANSGKVLDIASASKSSGANCQQYTSNGTAAQKFTVKYDGDGFYTIVNLNSGKALEVAGTAPVRSVNVQQGDLASTDAQKWAISDNRDGTYKLTSKATGLVLDVASASKANGANVDACTDNGTAAQKFTFSSVKGERVVADGDYIITSKLGANKVLDVANASKDNKAKIQIYKANGTTAQSFHFSYDEETGFYTIINNNSGKALDLPNAATSNGTKVQQYTSNGTLAQLWMITESSEGVYQIRSAIDTSKCIDIPNANTANGTKVQLYTDNGTDAQAFSIGTATDPYLIMGTSNVTAANLSSHYTSVVGNSYPSMVYASKGASSINDFCRILIEEAEVEGVRADVLYAQIMLETNYLRFGGDVSASQCNFGGLGATGGGAAGASFPDVRTGLRASVQHLKAYASTESLVNECVDPRFQYVTRGCALSVYDLSGKWATDPQYGNKIISIMRAL